MALLQRLNWPNRATCSLLAEGYPQYPQMAQPGVSSGSWITQDGPAIHPLSWTLTTQPTLGHCSSAVPLAGRVPQVLLLSGLGRPRPMSEGPVSVNTPLPSSG